MVMMTYDGVPPFLDWRQIVLGLAEISLSYGYCARSIPRVQNLCMKCGLNDGHDIIIEMCN